MRFSNYLKDKVIHIILVIFFLTFTLLIFRLVKVDISLVIMYMVFALIIGIILVSYDYLRKDRFYKKLVSDIKKLDKAYLISSTIEEPTFYDGKILYECLYDINKSMIENISKLENQNNDFKEYIEMWIHEVKLPLSSISLIIHNNKDKFDKSVLEQIKKIDKYVDEILYYSRSENSEKDYMITHTSLEKAVNNVLVNNKDSLLESKIKLEVNNLDYSVDTDIKWLEFIINQILSNSIKYRKKNPIIKIYAKEDKKKVTLYIEDNGIGIDSKDIKKVFNKTFTGSNGRESIKSTGMGLYIVKELCNKLGHKVSIESEKDKYTKVSITFNNDTIYDF